MLKKNNRTSVFLSLSKQNVNLNSEALNDKFKPKFFINTLKKDFYKS